MVVIDLVGGLKKNLWDGWGNVYYLLLLMSMVYVYMLFMFIIFMLCKLWFVDIFKNFMYSR